MMILERPALEKRVLEALDVHGRIPILLGGCGSGRTSLLLRLRDLIGRNAAQYVDVERIATTPERFLKALRDAAPFPADHLPAPSSTDGTSRDAFAAALTYFRDARGTAGDPVTFLLDEFLELRTFESFPGLRTVLRDLIAGLSGSPNRFVLTSRYASRAHRVLRDAPARYEVVPVSGLTAAEIRTTLPGDDRQSSSFKDDEEDHARDELAQMIQALSDGRPSYARMIAEAAAVLGPRGGADPVSALCSLLAPGGQLTVACRYCYELRLHRARGYGALKAILDVLAEEEPLTLTEVALRLRRTPGSTKDYLSWLEDVDLIASRQKRYSFADPLLRVWVRLHCRPTPPSEEDVAREIHGYVMARLPRAEPALALAGPPRVTATERSWGIIEID